MDSSRQIIAPMVHQKRQTCGFTLVEMLIAMAIFGLISLGSYSMFSSVIKIKDKTDVQSALLGNLQRSMVIIQNDIEQIVRRDVRDVFGDSKDAVSGSDYVVEFTRIGWNVSPFSRLKRSNLQRVRYQVEEGRLIRSHWLMLDQSDQSQPSSNALLEGVEEVRFRYLDRTESQGDVWRTSWPIQGLGVDDLNLAEITKIPVVVEMVIIHQKFGEIRRLFLLASGSSLPEPTELPQSASDDLDGSADSN